MAKFQRPARLNAEDYQGASEWFLKLFLPLNSLYDSLTTMFRKLTVTDNMSGGYFELDLNTTGGVDKPFPQRVKSQYGAAKEVQVVQALDVTKGRVPVSVSAVPAWDNVTDSYIQISALSGLSADKKYKIVFRYLTE